MKNINNIKQFVDKKLAIFLAVLIGLIGVLSLTFILTEINEGTPVADVNGNKIYMDEYENELKNEKHFLSYQGKEITKDLEGDVLGRMIEGKLVELYAQNNDISVNPTEVKERYEKAAESVGNEEEYLKKIKKIRGFTKEDIMSEIYNELLRNKVEDVLGVELESWLKEQKEKLEINKYEIN